MAWTREGEDDDDRGGPEKVPHAPHAVVAASAKAFKVRGSKGHEFWIPRSVIHDDSEVFEASGSNSHGKLVVKRWFIEKMLEDDPKKLKEMGYD